MSYIGDFKLANTLDTKFTTRQISGAPSTLASSPVISCYVGNGTTEITAGITLTVDFDSRTGLNNVRVVATGGNGYATATDNQLVITTGTVNSVSVVGEVVAEFSIENRRADVQFWNGTQVATPATAGIPDINVKNAANTAWGSGAITAASIAADAITAAKIADGAIDAATFAANAITATSIAADAITDAKVAADVTIASVTGAVGSVTGAVGSVTGAVGSVTGNVGGNVVGSVGSVTGAVGSVTGAVGSVTGNVGGNVVGSVASVTATVNADVKKINGTTIVGDGSGTPFNV